MSSFFALTVAAYPHNKNLEFLLLEEAENLAKERVAALTYSDIPQGSLLMEALQDQYGIEYVNEERWLMEAKLIIEKLALEFVKVYYDQNPYIVSMTLDKPRLFAGEISYGDFGNELMSLFDHINSLQLFEEPAN